jgi:hypothetical protein
MQAAAVLSLLHLLLDLQQAYENGSKSIQDLLPEYYTAIQHTAAETVNPLAVGSRTATYAAYKLELQTQKSVLASVDAAQVPAELSLLHLLLDLAGERENMQHMSGKTCCM